MAGIATGVVDKIPNDKLRNQMNDWIKHEANLGREGIRKATDIAQRANDAINTVRDEINNQTKSRGARGLCPKPYPTRKVSEAGHNVISALINIYNINLYIFLLTNDSDIKYRYNR